MSSAKALANEYAQIIDDHIGVFMDANMAMSRLLDWISTQQIRAEQKYGISVAKQDKASFVYGEGDPNAGGVPLHESTQLEMKQRVGKNGSDIRAISNMLVVSLYAYWEDHFRAKFAAALGRNDKSELKNQTFGDLGLIRNSIIHKAGVASSKVSRTKVLRWFKPGDQISFDQARLLELRDHLQAALEEVVATKP